MAGYWPNAAPSTITTYMNAMPKVAVSRTMKAASWNNTRVVRDIDAIAALKRESGKPIFVFGSAELANALLRAGTLDEVRMCTVPVLLGKGNPHFKVFDQALPMSLVEAPRVLSNGSIITRYAAK